MDLRRFSAILDAYGATPERWPAGERDAARALAQASLPAARALSRAQALDAVISQATIPDFEADTARFVSLHSAIVSAARSRGASWTSRWLGFDLSTAQLWPSLAGLAVATLLGFAVGLGGLIQLDEDHETDDVAILSPLDLPAAGQ